MGLCVFRNNRINTSDWGERVRVLLLPAVVVV